jgi:phosphohistidine phosphatase
VSGGLKRLILLRHAKSSWDSPKLEDHERPLSKRGARDAPAMGKRLNERGEIPALIITSDAERALGTARIVARELGLRGDALLVERGLYLAGPARILDIVSRQDERLASLMIVAHNPGLTELANRLLPKLKLANLPTAGLLAIDFEGDWADVARAEARLAYYDYPKRIAV